MANYITMNGLSERMTPATLADLCAGVTGPSQMIMVENIIERAESLVDGYLGKIYHTPLPKSAIVQEWAYTIAEYELYKRGGGNEPPAKYKVSRDETILQLKDALKGELRIPGATQRNSTVGNTLDMSSNEPMFTAHRRDHGINFDLF